MLLNDDTVLEVDNVAKLYSRVGASSRRRMASTFSRALFGRPGEPPKQLGKGEFWSLKDISFSLKRGEAIGIIGLNGAGKTTLLRILAGQILPDAGEIRVLGRTAAMIDLSAGFQTTASGARNIFLRGAMLGRSRDEIAASYDEIVAFAELGDAIDAPVNTYSSGMTMRLAFSIMVAMQPDILFIDEVLAVGDFQFRQKCLSKIRELRDRSAFVLVSHSMNDVSRFCNKVIVLEQGCISFIGKSQDAISFYETQKSQSEVGQTRNFLRMEIHNQSLISDVSSYWSDATGKISSEFRSGEKVLFHCRFKIHYEPTQLIVGVPVFDMNETMVMGFATDGSPINIGKDGEVSLVLEIDSLNLNPGKYNTALSIVDGVEQIYRQVERLTITPAEKRYWGFVSLPHSWKHEYADGTLSPLSPVN